MKAEDLIDVPREELARMLRQGHEIDPHSLDDTMYRGVSLGLPAWAVRLSWRTFRKVFHRDPATRELRGWNQRVEQEPPHRARVRRGAPWTFGHYVVRDLRPAECPIPIEKGVLLDYGAAGNPRLDPTALVRDPLVAVEPGSAELLLGWTYLRVAGRSIGTPSFFALQREGPLDHVVRPPSR
jgi:hypothetical protein